MKSKPEDGEGVKFHQISTRPIEDDDFQEIEPKFVKADILGKPNWSLRVNSSNKSQKRKSPGAKEKGKLVLEDDGDLPVKKKQCQSIAKGRASKSIRNSESEIFYGSSHIKKKKKISGGSPSSKKKKKVSKVKWKAVKLVENNNYPHPDLKMWEFYVHPDQHHSRKISTHTEEDDVKTIKEKLGNELLERFRGTCFGHFIDMPKFTVQNQLLHALLLREVKNPPRDDALWFVINDKKLRFGLREFGLVTGLKCQGDHLKDYSSDEPNRLIQLYFDGVAKVTKSSLVKCFMQQKWQNDDDAIKLAALYFIHMFLFSTKNSKKNDTNILKSEFNLVESGEWETFPWGVKVFQATKSSMHDRFTKHSEMYRFAGFPYALQVWFYECCPTVHQKIAYRVEKTSPHILNWTVKKSYFFEELQNGIFKLENDQIILNNIFPTDVESSKFQLPQFSDLEVAIYERGNEFDVEPPMKREGGYLHESSPLQRNEQGTTGGEPNWDIKQIFAQQVELKNEMASLKQYLVSTFELILTKLGSTWKKGDDENGVPEQQDHENAIDDEDIAIQVDPPHIEEENEDVAKDGHKSDNQSITIGCTFPMAEYNIIDAFSFDDFPLTSIGDVVKEKKVETIGANVDMGIISGLKQNPVFNESNAGENGGLTSTDPLVDAEPGFESDIVGVTESQWHCLTLKAAEVVTEKVHRRKHISAVQQVGKTVTPNQQVHEKVLSAEQAPSEVIQEHLRIQDVTPVLHGRTKKPGKFKRSPYVEHFSSSGSSYQLVRRRTFGMLHPFVCRIGSDPDYVEVVCKFSQWIDFKAKKRDKKEVYPKKFNELKPKFNFGVCMVDKKEWFHVLNYGTKPLSTMHLDVIFYYLRKRGKYDGDVAVKFTTTDSLPNATIRKVHTGHLKRDRQRGDLVDDENIITAYIRGDQLRCTLPWHMVDDVLFPIQVVQDWHWVLGRMSFKDRVIYVYHSSLDNPVYNEELIQAVEPYANLLPLYLASTGFYDIRSDLYYKGSPFEAKARSDPFAMVFTTEPPIINKCDYGLYVVAFAEYYIQDQCMPGEEFDISGARGRYAGLLWNYGIKKQEEDIVSDNEYN